MTRLLLALAVLLAPAIAAAQPQARTPRTPTEAEIAPLLGERWFGILMRGKQVGHRHWTLSREADGTYVSRDVGRLVLVTDGQTNETRYDETWRFAAAAPHRLVALDSSSVSRSGGSGERTELRCRLKGGRWHVAQRVGGELVVERQLAPSALTWGDYLRPQLVARAGAAKGATWKLPGFSIDELRHETETLELLEPAPDRYRFRATQEDGTRFDLWIGRDGRVHRVAIGSLFELRRCTADEARRLDGGFDVLHDLIVQVPPLGPPEHIVRLRLEIRGFPIEHLPTSARQTLVSRAGEGDDASAVVELRTLPYAPPDKGARPATALDPGRARALAATPAVPKDHPRIVALARSLTRGKPPAEAARAINRWVYDNLKKDYRSDAMSALTVLDQGSGDCTEHALLFVALCRAAGLPAREVSGLVYLWDQQTSGFGYHAWVEVWLPGGWHEMDPTWGEDAVNATHVRLAKDPEREGLALNATGSIRLAPAALGGPGARPRPSERVTLSDGRALPASLVGIAPDGALRLRTASAELLLPRAMVARIAFHTGPRAVDGQRLIDREHGYVLVLADRWSARVDQLDDAPAGAVARLERAGAGRSEAGALVFATRSSEDAAAHAEAALARMPALRSQRTRSYALPGNIQVDERLLTSADGRRVYLQQTSARGGVAVRLLAWCAADDADDQLPHLRALIRGLRWK